MKLMMMIIMIYMIMIMEHVNILCMEVSMQIQTFCFDKPSVILNVFQEHRSCCHRASV